MWFARNSHSDQNPEEKVTSTWPGEARARVRGDSTSTNIKFGQHKIRSNGLDILERDLKQTSRAERYCIFLFSSQFSYIYLIYLAGKTQNFLGRRNLDRLTWSPRFNLVELSLITGRVVYVISKPTSVIRENY